MASAENNVPKVKLIDFGSPDITNLWQHIWPVSQFYIPNIGSWNTQCCTLVMHFQISRWRTKPEIVTPQQFEYHQSDINCSDVILHAISQASVKTSSLNQNRYGSVMKNCILACYR